MIQQAELRDAARKLLADIATAHPDDAWRRMTDAGWPALTAPERLGGIGQTLAACCWLYMEIGGALSPAPLVASLLTIATLNACAPSSARDGWIKRIAGGERLAVSLLDPTRNSGRLASLHAVLVADRATHAMVILADEPLIAVMTLNGIQAVWQPTWDVTRDLFDLDIDSLQFDDATVIARGAMAEAGLSAFSTHLHIAIAADCVGAASSILDETVAYLKTRRQFGRPLAMFQALKHRCADLKATIMAAEALLLEYLTHINSDHVDSGMLARGAKSIASSRPAWRNCPAHGDYSTSSLPARCQIAESQIFHFLRRATLVCSRACPD